MRLTIECSRVKMAAGSDLLDDVFFNTEVDEKVVSDLVGSLESELTGSGRGNSAVRVQAAANHSGNPAVCGNSNVQDSKMGLSQELAKPGNSVQGGVINSTRSTMDTAAATTAAGSSMTAGHSQSKTRTAGGVVTVVPDHGERIGKTESAGVQTLNGSSVVINSHNLVSSASSTVPAVTIVYNGPGSVVKGNVILPSTSSTVIQTSLMDNAVTSTVISSQPSVLNSVPTVTLVRPPMQTPGAVTSLSGSNTFLTSSVNVAHPACSGAQINKSESPKTTIQKTAQVTGTATALEKSPSTIAISPGGIRAIAPQVLAPRLPQPQQNAPNIQNIQLPPGMVLVRSESGQLLMIHQQTLAQMQAQSQSPMTPRPATPTSTPPVQITSVQAPGMPLMARQVTPTIIKQGTPAQTTVLQRPPVLQQNTIVLGGAAATPGQAPVQPGSAAAAVNQRAGTPGATGTPSTPTTETLENVKKCKNFLSTLIKLASSGKQSSETTASVKDLVKSLLEGKIEAEEFTSRLYRELNSSPQPYLVPFLKRSLPALRQMTPDSTAFIQQSQLPQASVQPASSSTALTAVVLGGTATAQRLPLNRTTTASPGAKGTMHQSPVISQAQTPHSKPGLQQGALASTQVTLAQSPMVTFRGQSHSRIIMGHPQVVKQLQTVPVVKQALAPGAKVTLGRQSMLSVAQKNKLKEASGGTFKDDDDINDVASMAGVNLSEESARILATNSELVGAVTRSCKDEAFLYTTSLTRRVQEIGRRFGVIDLGPEVINYVSHATQQRLQNLLEKVTEVAQQKNITFKEDDKYEQVSDVRAQLKFYEQLDQMEKQRKEEQEREILMKAAKSRSRQEDPEQLRLKQKAKEMQQQELNQIRQKEANMTALAAIGPRKKRKMESPVNGAGAEGSGSGPSSSVGANSGGSRPQRQRITRVNLRDLLFCLENERETSSSHLLYKGFLK
ncbi:transcription initiation factor TFIID subunit 4 isoform X1 [Salmo salar]|uniref:Transcription initiation factor TFIID subunit 4 isoform X1 n=1 Tax=Salmo salar TaxID=8030 RepID=A0A1S3MCQ9_SALSA|nr:transcription initiation factor TFIID subunit 4-like isoform X1 [Salmo salar]|eukprot:XP_014000967.1 PREDICTED: transcription initiation factor TFIID subunit 4-like isoform X2 [Salmo salar]